MILPAATDLRTENLLVQLGSSEIDDIKFKCVFEEVQQFNKQSSCIISYIVTKIVLKHTDLYNFKVYSIIRTGVIMWCRLVADLTKDEGVKKGLKGWNTRKLQIFRDILSFR